tara:strand:+ start:320 stop:529 length:210 start_codon:yes stop_codon:yes gene_type:complete
MNVINFLIGSYKSYKYISKGIKIYHITTTTVATFQYLKSWYNYFNKNNDLKIIIVEEKEDNWVEIKNME